jgi:hypothetical protein
MIEGDLGDLRLTWRKLSLLGGQSDWLRNNRSTSRSERRCRIDDLVVTQVLTINPIVVIVQILTIVIFILLEFSDIRASLSQKYTTYPNLR